LGVFVVFYLKDAVSKWAEGLDEICKSKERNESCVGVVCTFGN
jgi:hypothetical protein